MYSLGDLFLQDHCLSSWLQSSFWKQLPNPFPAFRNPLMLPKYPCLMSWNRQHPGMCNNLSSSSAKAFSHKFFLYRILCLVAEPDYPSWDPQHRFPLQFLSADTISGKGMREISLTWTLQNNISLEYFFRSQTVRADFGVIQLLSSISRHIAILVYFL